MVPEVEMAEKSTGCNVCGLERNGKLTRGKITV